MKKLEDIPTDRSRFAIKEERWFTTDALNGNLLFAEECDFKEQRMDMDRSVRMRQVLNSRGKNLNLIFVISPHLELFILNSFKGGTVLVVDRSLWHLCHLIKRDS